MPARGGSSTRKARRWRPTRRPSIELIGQNARERLTAVKRGLRSILDLIGPNGDTREFRLSPPAARLAVAREAGRQGEGDRGGRPRHRPAGAAAPKPLAALIDLHVASGVSRTRTSTGCSAAWLAHLTGGQGVAGSNPAIPTIFPPKSLPHDCPIIFVEVSLLFCYTQWNISARCRRIPRQVRIPR